MTLAMSNIKYLSFNHVNPVDLMAAINDDALRTHLIDHPYFDTASTQTWIDSKREIDAMPDCRVRVIFIGGVLAGWCGIQPDDNGYELAIVISKKFWGFGISIFKTLIGWAEELGHKEVLFHLLESRPEYKALRRIATKVYQTNLAGRRFTTYQVSVAKQLSSGANSKT